MNFAPSETPINIRAGIMKSGKSNTSINAPTDTKNKAATYP
jgi:hypothetical protein